VLLGPLLLATIFHNNYDGLYLVIIALCLIAAALTFFLPSSSSSEGALSRATVEVARGPVALAPLKRLGNLVDQEDRNGIKIAFDELVEGARFIRSDRVIVSAIVYWSIAIAVFMMLGTIGPLFLKHVLNIDQSRLIFILVPGGVGLVLGVVAVGRVSTPANRETMINWGLLAAGITLVLFSVAYPILNGAYKLAGGIPPEMVVLGVMGFITLLLGLSNSFISIPAQTALQERSPENIRARVFSAFYTVQNVVLILPVLLVGVLADTFGYIPTVIGIGVVVMLIAGFGLNTMRRQKNAEPILTVPSEPEDYEGNAYRAGEGKPTLHEKAAGLVVAAPTPLLMPTAKHPDGASKSKETER
jgi:hypothetical protein